MMKRRASWRPDLHRYLLSVWRKPLVWGDHDPPLFVAGAINSMTGVDPGADYRGRYTTMLGGLRLLRRNGFKTPADLYAGMLPEVKPARAQVGDVALVQVGQDIGLGIVQGPRIYVLRPGAAGVGTVDLLTAKRAFRV